MHIGWARHLQREESYFQYIWKQIRDKPIHGFCDPTDAAIKRLSISPDYIGHLFWQAKLPFSQMDCNSRK